MLSGERKARIDALNARIAEPEAALKEAQTRIADLERLLERLEILQANQAPVLDLGSGTGLASRKLASKSIETQSRTATKHLQDP